MVLMDQDTIQLDAVSMFRGFATLNLTVNQQMRRDIRENLGAKVGSFPWPQVSPLYFLDQRRTQSHPSLGHRTFLNHPEAANRQRPVA